MPWTVYILYSAERNRFYTGCTKRWPDRMKEHRAGRSAWTRRASDWGVVYRQEVDTEQEARALEKKIKARGARRYLCDIGCPMTDAQLTAADPDV